MLRDDRQLALHQVILCGKKSIEHYRHVIEASEERDLTALLASLLEPRRAILAQLEPHMYKIGDMPSMPDPEKLALEEFIIWLKGALSGDEREAVLERLQELDEELIGSIENALRQELPDETKKILQQLKAAVSGAQKRLAALKGR